jgi:biotin synthase
MVRLSAGRLDLSDEAQALCFLAGANSIFMGEKLLTTPNPETDRDNRLLDKLGMKLYSEARSPGSNGSPHRPPTQADVKSVVTARSIDTTSVGFPPGVL